MTGKRVLNIKGVGGMKFGERKNPTAADTEI